LKIDPATNETKWRSENTPVSDYLAAILSQMIRYNHQERFQNVGEVLQVIQQIKWPDLPENIPTTQPQITAVENIKDAQQKSYPLLAGLKSGIAINSLLIGLGVYALFNTSISHSETESLAKIETWQKQIHNPLQNKDSAYWQSKIDKQVIDKQIQQPEVNLEIKAHTLLNKAYSKAASRDFSSALEYLRQIPPDSYAGTIVEKKLVEYNQKRQLRAAYFLYKANNKASVGDLASAIKLLQKISPDTAIYPHAQIKLNEYSQSLNLHHLFWDKADTQSKHLPRSFHPEHYLSEVNVKVRGNREISLQQEKPDRRGGN
jgi:hypothetical protein